MITVLVNRKKSACVFAANFKGTPLGLLRVKVSAYLVSRAFALFTSHHQGPLNKSNIGRPRGLLSDGSSSLSRSLEIGIDVAIVHNLLAHDRAVVGRRQRRGGLAWRRGPRLRRRRAALHSEVVRSAGREVRVDISRVDDFASALIGNLLSLCLPPLRARRRGSALRRELSVFSAFVPGADADFFEPAHASHPGRRRHRVLQLGDLEVHLRGARGGRD